MPNTNSGRLQFSSTQLLVLLLFVPPAKSTTAPKLDIFAVKMAMYTNQTAEELETWRCTSDGIFKSQNSIWMKINFVFVFILIFLTFYLSFKAARVLKNHNVYSKGSQILLMITLLNANLNQLIFLEIRVKF